jgi:hypothetical protein
VDPARDRAGLGLLPRLRDAPAFHAREGEHDRERELAEDRRRVDAEVDGGEDPAVRTDVLDELQRASHAGAREAVEAGHGDAARLSGADALDDRVEPGARELAARLIEVGPPRGISTPRIAAHCSICARCMSGEMKDEPSRPRTWETRM